MSVAEKRSSLRQNVQLHISCVASLRYFFKHIKLYFWLSGKRQLQLVHQRKLEVLVLLECGDFTQKIPQASKCKELLKILDKILYLR